MLRQKDRRADEEKVMKERRSKTKRIIQIDRQIDINIERQKIRNIQTDKPSDRETN